MDLTKKRNNSKKNQNQKNEEDFNDLDIFDKGTNDNEDIKLENINKVDQTFGNADQKIIKK